MLQQGFTGAFVDSEESTNIP